MRPAISGYGAVMIDLATSLVIGRLTLGTALTIAPSVVLRPWLGAELSPEVRALARMLGVRDLLLGVWLLDRRGSAGAQTAAAAGAIADAADALAALGLVGRRRRSLAVAAVALSGSLAGIRLAREQRA